MNGIRMYPAVFRRLEDGGFDVTFPDLPSRNAQGENMVEAFVSAQNLLDRCLECRKRFPRPTEIERIEAPKDGYVLFVQSCRNRG